MRLGASRGGVACVALAFFVSTGAPAQPRPEPLDVSGNGTCPAADAVRTAIFQLTSPERRSALPDSRVTVSDAGARYVITVTSEGKRAEKSYDDPARDCARRARFAAVFAVLTLMPPELAEPAPSKNDDGRSSRTEPPGAALRSAASAEKPPQKAALPALPPSVEAAGPANVSGEKAGAAGRFSRAHVVRLEARGRFEIGLSTSRGSPTSAFAGELTALLPGRVTPLLGVAYSPPANLALLDGRVEVRRLEALVGARAGYEFGITTLAAELAALACAEQAKGYDVEFPADGTTYNLGLRAAALFALWPRHIGPVLALHATLFPAPTPVRGLPRGTLGHLPHTWLGLSAGVGLGL